MGKRKIIVSERDNIAALFEDDRAIEFIINRGDMLLGDVYLASVENILPSIDAAFVNVGGDKMGFLHSSDVPGKGDLKNRLQPKQTLVVQVMKEPTGHKGPRVTTNISLPGRFLVLMPESRGISISRKIESPQERARLKSIVSLIKPPGMGIIIRTEADLQKESDIQEDFETLLERWQNIVAMADSSTPPTLLYRDQDLLYRVIREAVTDDVKELFVDTNFGLQRAQQLLQNWNMDKALKVNLYSGNQSILVSMGVDKEIKLALQTKVPLPSGGYLYIQPTEALSVVDVNSGKFTSLQSQSETIKQTNLEACKEIARQLRLRNIGGMIIVDFIDMESRADKLAILEAFENELAPDKSKPQIGQLSDLGLVEMTRHRQGQALSEIFTKKCIACNGNGHAVEEFNWAPPMLDGDPRTMGRPGSMRSKLPMRNMRWQQNQSKQPAHSAVPTISLKKLMDPAKPEPALQETKPTILQQMHSAKAKQTLPEDKLLAEFLKDKTAQTLGTRFANFVKLAHMPPGINSVMVRINPKANDILTLVDTIEGSSQMPIGMGMGDDDGDDDMNDGFDAEDTPQPPQGQGSGRRNGGMHHYNGPHDSEGEPLGDDEEAPPMPKGRHGGGRGEGRGDEPRPDRGGERHDRRAGGGRGEVRNDEPRPDRGERYPAAAEHAGPRGRSQQAVLPSIDIEITDPVEEAEILDAEPFVAIEEVDEIRPRRGRPAVKSRPEPAIAVVEDIFEGTLVKERDLDDEADLDEADEDLILDDDEDGEPQSVQPAGAKTPMPHKPMSDAAKRRRGRPAKRSNKPPLRGTAATPQPPADTSAAPPVKRGRRPAAPDADED